MTGMDEPGRAVPVSMSKESNQTHSIKDCFCQHGPDLHRYHERQCDCGHAPGERPPHQSHRLTLCNVCKGGPTGPPDMIAW